MWFMINGMIVPGSSYWTIAFGKGKGEVAGGRGGHDYGQAIRRKHRLAL